MTINEATKLINVYIDDYKYVVLSEMANDNQAEELTEAYPIWLKSNPSTLEQSHLEWRQIND